MDETMDEIKQRILRVIAETLQLDDEDIAVLREDVGYRQIRKWNSARHAEIIVAIEDEFDIEIDERSISKLNDVPKIVEYVSTH
jgi:acyl carrier protein